MYKKSTDDYFFGPNTDINQRIILLNNNGDKKRKYIITLIKNAFQLKYDYIYNDEYFYTISSLSQYGIALPKATHAVKS